ncbi:MAG: DUF504 domain-containing protein [Infirmifilum sp.]
MKNPMRNFFQRVLWDKNMDKGSLRVKFISRGVSGELDEFTGEQIREVTRDGVVIVVDGKDKFIPFHRITEITYKNGKIVFSKQGAFYDFKV